MGSMAPAISTLLVDTEVTRARNILSQHYALPIQTKAMVVDKSDGMKDFSIGQW